MFEREEKKQDSVAWKFSEREEETGIVLLAQI